MGTLVESDAFDANQPSPKVIKSLAAVTVVPNVSVEISPRNLQEMFKRMTENEVSK